MSDLEYFGEWHCDAVDCLFEASRSTPYKSAWRRIKTDGPCPECGAPLVRADT